jgi:hypothetical protein
LVSRNEPVSVACTCRCLAKTNHQKSDSNGRLKKIPSTFGLSPRAGGNKEITEALPEEETNYL